MRHILLILGFTLPACASTRVLSEDAEVSRPTDIEVHVQTIAGNAETSWGFVIQEAVVAADSVRGFTAKSETAAWRHIVAAGRARLYLSSEPRFGPPDQSLHIVVIPRSEVESIIIRETNEGKTVALTVGLVSVGAIALGLRTLTLF